MTDATQIHPDKLRAFRNTSYRLGHTEHDIVLKVGQYSPRLAELYQTHGVTCGALSPLTTRAVRCNLTTPITWLTRN